MDLTDQTIDDFYEFGKFRLDAARCVLLDGENAVVDITPKALEILCILVKNGGRVVSKEEILNSVWAGSYVEEANLSHHIFRLRKALGENEDHKFIETVSKRGYRFIGKINQAGHAAAQTGAIVAEQTRYPGRGHSGLLVSAIVLILLAASLSLYWLSRSAARAEERAKSPVPVQKGLMTTTRVTNSGKVGGSTISPDGKFIAYIQNSYDGEGMVYIRQTDTNNEIKILPPGERTFGGTAFSPDSRWVYYVAFEASDPRGALYRIPVLGGVPARLISNVPSMFTISPDGTQVCFYRNDDDRQEQSLMIAALDGTSERAILVRPYSDHNFSGCPAWSPGGDRIAYAVYNEETPNGGVAVRLFAIDIARGTTDQLTGEVWSEIGKMNWLADGSGLVFVGTRPRVGLQIYLLSYPGGDIRRITNELNTYGNYGMGVTADGTTLVADIWESSAQLWSVVADGDTRDAVQLTSGDSDGAAGVASLPDGQIVYSSRTGFDYDLWALRDDAGNREGKPLTSDEYFEGDVAAAPRGEFLVFASDRNGNQHIFRTDRSGANIRQLTFGDGSDTRPDVSPDGSWVVYASWQNVQSRIWKVPADGGAPVQLTDYDTLAPSISPDGKLVACIAPSRAKGQTARLDILSFETGKIVRSFDIIPHDFNYRPPRWTPTGDSLVYRRVDKNVGNLWKQRLTGGDPQPFTNFRTDIIFGFSFTNDGKRLVVSRGKRTVNVVLLKNFL